MAPVDTDPGQGPLVVDTDELQPLPYYEGIVVPVVGENNVLAGWRFDDPVGAGQAFDVKGSAQLTAGGDVTQGEATTVTERPLAARVASSVPGDAFSSITDIDALDLGDVATTPFSIFCWAKLDGTAAGGLFGKIVAPGTNGYLARLRPDVDPDQMQWSVNDGTTARVAFILDNAVSDDQWHMWTFVNDPVAGELRVHRDKNAPATGTSAGVGDVSNGEPFVVGDDIIFRSMCGLINHLYVCSVALTQGQIDALFDGG